MTDSSDYENLYALHIPFSFIRKMEYDEVKSSKQITVLLYLRSPAEIRKKKYKNIGGNKQYDF